jgi:hypothetical protein
MAMGAAMIATGNLAELASWTGLIHDAVHEPNPALGNLKITRAHYLLSQALGEVVGADAGANFHTWAVWGSRKAGVTIRREGLDRAMREVSVLSFCAGLLIGFALAVYLAGGQAGWIVPVVSAVGGLCGLGAGRFWLSAGQRRAAELMLRGNSTVLEEIGGQTARFLAWYHSGTTHEPGAFDRFLDGFRPGGPEEGGQDLLRRAFTQYYRAALTGRLNDKRQWTYLANCLAIWHEHVRLQPCLAGALPWVVRRCVTQRLMRYDVGPLRIAVADDVPNLEGLEHPEAMECVTDPELIELLFGPNGLDRGGRQFTGRAARDWTNLRQRLKYLVNLFRALHLNYELWTPPYSGKQFAAIEAGRIPPGPL